MAGQSAVLPVLEERETTRSGSTEWLVIVFDNPVNTWDEVILILQKATACTLEEAQMETWEVHHLGKSIVHHSDREECERVASVIRTIKIQVEVRQL